MTGERTALTSVVLPVWDGYVGERLAQAIESVQRQDVPAPVLLVDNASRVELPTGPGVQVVRSPARLTLGEARNLGVKHVTTPLVVVWDADDVMLPGTLSFLQAAIESDPNLAAFATAIVEHPSAQRHRWPRSWTAQLTRQPRLFAVLDAIWSLYPTTGSTIMRTELVRAAAGYADADSGEDWCLGVSLAFRGRIGWSERPGRVYRVHDQSVWARHMSVRHQLRHAAAVRERVHADPGIPDWARTAVPLIRFLQYAAIASHAVLAGSRRLLSRDRTKR